MKIELKKETRLNGEIWFCIYVDEKYLSSFPDEFSANEMFEEIKTRQPKAKIELLKSETI